MKEKIKSAFINFFSVVLSIMVFCAVIVLLTGGQGRFYEIAMFIGILAVQALTIAIIGVFVTAVLKGGFYVYKTLRYGTSEERLYVIIGITLLLLSLSFTIMTPMKNIAVNAAFGVVLYTLLPQMKEIFTLLGGPIQWNAYKIIFGAIFLISGVSGIALIAYACKEYLERNNYGTEKSQT
jgi:hypothetical protein